MIIQGEYKEKLPNIRLLRNILFTRFLLVTANFFRILSAAKEKHTNVMNGLAIRSWQKLLLRLSQPSPREVHPSYTIMATRIQREVGPLV